MGHINKTDKLDADGLALLLHLGTLPQVWIPPGELRDERELPRTRMALTPLRTALKNRIHATLAKYGLAVSGVSDLFGERGRQELGRTLDRLPPETRRCLEEELESVDHLGEQIRQLENRIRERVREERAMQLLKTLPGVGDNVIGREMGEISRFPDGEVRAGILPAPTAYAGVVPKVKSSGDRVRYGHLRSVVGANGRSPLLPEMGFYGGGHCSMPGRPMEKPPRLPLVIGGEGTRLPLGR